MSMIYSKSVLALDIGGGTQDILLYEHDKNLENCCKLVLPSPTLLVKQLLTEATLKRVPVFLNGPVMGGGHSSRGVKNHLAAGLQVYATATAAKTIHDDLDRVEQMGVVITDTPPTAAQEIMTGDLDLPKLYALLDSYYLPRPQQVAVAVQDHGEAVGESNRQVRSRHWAQFISSGGNPQELLYYQVPPQFTRMKAITQACPNAIIMDTGPAAIEGALADSLVAEHHSNRGVTVVNVGNMHTLAFLIKENRIWGMFEHHTSMLTPDKLAQLISELQQGLITQEIIYNDGGHGGMVNPDFPANSFDFLVVTGPNRTLATSMSPYFAAPFGDMMLTGCFGLIKALAAK